MSPRATIVEDVEFGTKLRRQHITLADAMHSMLRQAQVCREIGRV